MTSGGLSLAERLQLARGILRSLKIYYGDRARRRAMAALYGRFVNPGDLVFDIGAHVGDRVSAFRALGCRVVALEPQPDLVRVLRWLHARPGVTILQAAAAAAEGRLALHLNLANPTVATGSPAFIDAARDADGWREQAWTRHIEVPQTTLDRLIAEQGRPAFVKIDVEGFEAEVLRGLSQSLPALSFEFTIIQRDVALDALACCTALGSYRFNAALGESQRLVFDEWLNADAIAAWLNALPMQANSGDIYAALNPPV